MSLFYRFSRHVIKPHKQTRSIWVRLTATGANVHDCADISLATLEKKSPNVCVVLASKSFTLKNYKDLICELNIKLNKPSVMMGGVIDRVPHVDHGISLLLGFDEHVVPFTITDDQHRLKIRNTAVGRWGRQDDVIRLKYQNDHLDNVNWENFGSINTPVQPFQLPSSLENSLKTVPSFLFTLSDNEPEQLLQTFDHHYANVPKVGLIGASTPFVTGEPYCLFRGEEIMGSGIVGFASYGAQQLQDMKVCHTAMEKLGKPMKITRCQGNVILDVEAGGATGLLLQLIQHCGPLSKDEEFYAGIYPLEENELDESMRVSRITSGDPSRGNMSIDTTADLQVGQTIQFLRKKTVETIKNVSSDTMIKDNIIFGVSEKDDTIDMMPIKIPNQANVIKDCFGGVSENGVILGRSHMSSELLDVPFSKVMFKL
ncbi:uncharacterized protein BX663DRAFT_540603 [Cokeromyces recurvatus]|uniref:uncharacterized protein n=1 Tax=Cokeromyces recurvatus TaxID=90255 RepID=UPI00222081EE|nr:uncharacterized protein BX663DRAFT_540603 [Cokeromyces recurvatus]KAI7905933.1 hypothetical protein BX663DRAFT_540603 [Cokeromyces recurvatus]